MFQDVRYALRFWEHHPWQVVLAIAALAIGAAQFHKWSGHGENAVGTKRKMTPVAFVPVQSNDAKDLGAGKLLVASRDMGDPNFAKTVILLIHYDDEGVVGLVLNRRTDVA